MSALTRVTRTLSLRQRVLWAALLIWTLLAVVASPRSSATQVSGTGPMTLRVGVDPSFVPFEFYTGPETPPIGYDIDLAGALAKRLNRELVIVPMTYDGFVDALRTGAVDAVISAFPPDQRLTQDLHFSGAYFNAGPTLVVRDGETLPNRPLSLAVELGSAADLAARRLKPPPAAIRRLPGTDAVVEAVRSGEVDAGLMDMVSALQADKSVTPLGYPIENEFYTVAVRLDQQGLAQEIDAALELLRAEGYLDALAVKWMGRAAPRP
ncbi:MAG: ABC transporter substrate-binding protein [Anaerolineae bacterium]